MAPIPSATLSGPRLLAKAREVAAAVHEGQFRLDGRTPYLRHPERVAECFDAQWARDGLDRGDGYHRGMALCLCHDIAEHDAKNPLSRAELEDAGLAAILPDLDLLTHAPGTSYLDYILRIRASKGTASLAPLVKLADMEANMGDLARVPFQAAAKGMRTKWELARWILTH